MLLREPVEPQQQLQEQALGSDQAFEWPGVDAVIESYRQFNKGNSSEELPGIVMYLP